MLTLSYFWANFGWAEFIATAVIVLLIVMIRERKHIFRVKKDGPNIYSIE